MVVTEQAVFRFRDGSLALTELLDGATVEDVEAATEARFDVELEVQSDPHRPRPRARRTRAAGRPAVLLRGLRRHAARSPKEPLFVIPHTLSEATGPVFGDRRIVDLDHDLTRQHSASRSASGSSSRRVLGSMASRCRTSSSRSGRRTPPAATATRSTTTTHRSIRTSRARALPDRRRRPVHVHHRQARCLSLAEPPECLAREHIHFSLFGRAFTKRLVTQMYFPGDPLFDSTRSSTPSATRGHASGLSAGSTST